MHTSLHIESFGILQNLEIVSLERVNLIVGRNNTGKSTLLKYLATNTTLPVEFVKSGRIDWNDYAKLWDKVVFDEDKVRCLINALKIIDPSVEAIAFVGEVPVRIPLIKLETNPNAIPLPSLGEGTKQMLVIILALVKAENGYLLVDNIETGLHYTVQEQLWKIIFETSEKLNVQVFATTQSRDCVRGFEAVLNHKNNSTTGQLIRIENNKGSIKSVEFNGKDLDIVVSSDIEIR